MAESTEPVDVTPSGERVADVIVLGAGPVGENVAQYVVDGGGTAILVERDRVGGECSYFACMPSKALLRPVEVAATAAHLQGVETPRVLPDELLARRDVWVSGYDDSGQVSWAEDAGIALVRGTGRLAGERRVVVTGGTGDSGRSEQGETTLVARQAVVLATGSTPVMPDIYRTVLPWVSRDATGVKEIPSRLAIVGGGVVACEAATWLTALGAQVTLLVRGERLLATTEPFAGDTVLTALRDAGVDVRLRTEVVAADRDDPRDTGLGRVHGGAVRLGLRRTGGGSTSDADEELTVDELLVAAGRRPALDDVGLESVGLDSDSVQTDARPDWLHLVGDASGEAPLTHWGKYRARILGESLAQGQPAEPAPGDVPVPQVVFTDPQVASVGRTEAQARRDGLDVVTSHVPWTAAAGAGLLRDDADGGATIVVRRDTGTLVGATFVGPEAGELLHAATIAITGGVPVPVLRHAVPAYPTASELWLRLLESLPAEVRSGVAR